MKRTMSKNRSRGETGGACRSFRDLAADVGTILFALLLLFAAACCSKGDQGPKNCVIGLLEREAIVSHADRYIDLGDPTVEIDDKKSEEFFKAKRDLEKMFVSRDVEKRVLAALRLYRPKAWEYLKTVREPAGDFVVMFLRSDSKLMGEEVDKRPGWRKALFRLEQKEAGWVIADIDEIIKKFGDKPFYKESQE